MKYKKQLFDKLRTRPSTKTVFNQYSDKYPKGKTTLNNLRLYLDLLKPKIILVGEAPGYNGCRWSGIPFTSEYIMLNRKFRIFGQSQEFQQSSAGQLKKEISATIVWGTIKDMIPLPLLWNIFPFHPHKPDGYSQNRKPTTRETEEGKEYLNHIKNIYPNARLIAVGEVAHKRLKELNIDHSKVRHPSHGGKEKFQKGIKELESK